MDSISKLPDSIRNHILSFLPMYSAIRTSALSKQWRNVCSSLPSFEFWELHFEDEIKKGYSFKDIVDQTICRHDGSSIERFKLLVNAEDLNDDTRIVSWITFAIKHKVKDLIINIRMFSSLPDCLFTCESLTKLHLVGVAINAPAELRFPMLIIFQLAAVKFNGNNQTNQVVVNCHLLESLIMLRCSCNNIDDLIIHALNLKTLSLLLFRSYAQNVTVHCPHLSRFQYYGNPPNISSDSLSSLLDASYNTTLAQNVDDQRVSKIVMGLSNVVSLSLDYFCIEILSRNGAIIANQAPLFFCLKSLSVTMVAKENHVYFMPFLLKIYPNLNTLNIYFKEHDEQTYMLNMGGYFHQQQLSDDVSLESLEKVKIRDFEGSECEFYLVRLLLEKAKILKEIEIACSYKFDDDGLQIISITERITQIIAVSPFVTTTILSRKEAINKTLRAERSVC